jgi:hypothetical protein
VKIANIKFLSRLRRLHASLQTQMQRHSRRKKKPSLRQPDATTRDDQRAFQNTPIEERLSPVNAPEKAIEGSCSSSCLGRSFLASLATAQRAKSGLTAARPVSRSNGEGENHGHICLCQIISARDTAVCLRRFPELKQHQRPRETRRCSERRHRDRIALPPCLFSR